MFSLSLSLYFSLLSLNSNALCFSVLTSNLVFNLNDGQFVSRVDLIDAPGSSLGRGAQVAGLGM